MSAAAAPLCAAALLAACGGGGGSTSGSIPAPIQTLAPTAAPSPLPSPAAQINTASVAVSSSAATTAQLPVTGGIAPTVTIPKVTSGSGSLAVTVATGADISTARQARVRESSLPGGSYLVQMSFVPSADMTFGAAPSFSLDVTKYVTDAGFTVAEAAAYLQFLSAYAGIEDGNGNFNVVGPLTIQATNTALTVSYSGPPMTLTLKANQQYTIGVHLGPISAPTSNPTSAPTSTPTAIPTATPTAQPTATPTAKPTATPTAQPTATPTAKPTATPTAQPTATPTATPTAAPMTADPASLNLMGTGSSNMQFFIVDGGSGAYHIGSYDSGVISVQADPSDPQQIDVTPVAAGTTNLIINDDAGDSVTVPVTVTTATGTVN